VNTTSDSVHGTLAEADRAMLERYLRGGHFLNVVQAKARVCLSATAAAGT